MKRKLDLFKYLFFINAALHLIFILLDLHFAILITKVLLIPLLILYNWFSISVKVKGSVQLFVGLFFSWVGDIFLLKSDNEMYFIFGLASFLCAHIAYVFLFRELRFIFSDVKVSAIYILLFFMYAIGLLIFIYPNLGDLAIPVIVYAIVITLMGISALLRIKNTSVQSFWIILCGAIFFIVSDSIIALNKFYHPILFADFFIMLTYIVSQYLISFGSQKHIKETKTYI